MTQCTSQQVRILAHDGETWHIDPRLEDIELTWSLWVYARKPFAVERVQWDLGDYYYNNLRTDKSVGSFPYSTKLERSILNLINQKE